jgi:hypothetical protein
LLAAGKKEDIKAYKSKGHGNIVLYSYVFEDAWLDCLTKLSNSARKLAPYLVDEFNFSKAAYHVTEYLGKKKLNVTHSTDDKSERRTSLKFVNCHKLPEMTNSLTPLFIIITTSTAHYEPQLPLEFSSVIPCPW